MDINRSAIVSHFASNADRYARVRDVPPRDNFMMKVFQPLAEERLKVLDLGCGTGHRLEGLSIYYPRFDLYGVDITPEMINIAVARRPKTIHFMVGDCLHTSFNDAAFEVVIMSEVLHHLITNRRKESCALREAALKELVRLVDPDGFIVLEEVCVNSRWRAAAIFRFSYMFSRLNISIPALNIHQGIIVNFFTPDELKHTLARLGLAIVEKDVRVHKTRYHWISNFLSYPQWATYVLKRAR